VEPAGDAGRLEPLDIAAGDGGEVAPREALLDLAVGLERALELAGRLELGRREVERLRPLLPVAALGPVGDRSVRLGGLAVLPVELEPEGLLEAAFGAGRPAVLGQGGSREEDQQKDRGEPPHRLSMASARPTFTRSRA